MSPREDRLRNFFGGYFNQDWSVSGAQSWRDVIAEFVRQVPRSHAMVVIEDIREWLKLGWNNLPAEFGCDYDPRPDGQTARQWVADVADAIENQLDN